MSPHPIANFSISIKNFKCFDDVGSGFFQFSPTTVVIGKNNSGKSSIANIVEIISGHGSQFKEKIHQRNGSVFSIEVRRPFLESELRAVFPESMSGGGIPGSNHWDYGRRLVGKPAEFSVSSGWSIELLNSQDIVRVDKPTQRRLMQQISERLQWPVEKFLVRKIEAERMVTPEGHNNNLSIRSTGQGITNVVRAFINSENLDRSEVEDHLLADINRIFLGDAEFTAITVQESANQVWEIFLRENQKGDIRLSQSGSSLQSIFLICAMLRLEPKINNLNWENSVLIFEEPENNLHPALFRRLLDFLETKRKELGFYMIITTHSPICIDWSLSKSDVGVLHVHKSDGRYVCSEAGNYEKFGLILNDLDVRGSDILQSNGVIWVEGPSDRIYINKWIELASDGELTEGTHYRVLFYGGRILSHFDALDPEEKSERVQIFSINRNCFVLIDSDRKNTRPTDKQPRMRINETKKRIKREIESNSGICWITKGKEIENYIPNSVWSQITGPTAGRIGIYDDVPAFVFKNSSRSNKVALAHEATALLDAQHLEFLDLKENLMELIEAIRSWNHM